MVRIVAHRGASAYEPENTLRAVRRALEMGADAVEVDVRLTRDGHIVVIHDATVDRTTDGRGAVAEMALSRLRGLDAGKGEHIPTLREVINVVGGEADLFVEIKVPGSEGKVLDVIRESGAEGTVTLVSFHHPSVLRARELEPRVRTGVILVSRPVTPTSLALDAKADVLLPRYTHVDAEMVAEAHRCGLAVIPWTVDDPGQMRRLMALGVDGMATNRPDVLRRLRGR